MAVRRRALVFAASALGLFALGADSLGQAGTAPRPAPAIVTSVATGAVEDLQLVRGGIGSPLGAGERVAIGGDLTATVEFRPASQRYARTLRMTLSDTGGAVRDAVVRVAASMRFMDHGRFNVVATGNGDGTYSATLPFVMGGEWELRVSIATGASTGELVLDLAEYD